MKRVAIAVVLGTIFPLAYTIVMGTITEMIPQYVPDSMQLFGKQSPSLIFAPTLWPIYFFQWLSFHQFFGYGLFLDNFIFRGTVLILGNIVPYSLIAYLMLRRFDASRKAATQGSERPPLPPAEWS